MQSPFPFDTLVLFGFLSTMLLCGVAMRARISGLQRFLFPSCLVGGTLGLLLMSSGILPIRADDIQTFAYHCFNLSFISVGLTQDEKIAVKGRTRTVLRGSVWMALTQGVTFPLQALIGGVLVIAFGLGGMDLFPTFGFLAPLGFNEGPGQALSFGKVWQQVGFEHGATVGLTFAAMGYFFAFFIGVPLVNRGLRKRNATGGVKALAGDVRTGLLKSSAVRQPAGQLTTHSSNIDTLAYQCAVVGLVYLVTYGLVAGIVRLLPADAGAMLWGFFFFFGLAVALLVRKLMGIAGVAHLMDPGMQRRITGWSVDYLIVATVTGIQLAVVWAYWLPITAIGLTAGIVTTVVVLVLGRRLDNYRLERTVAIYGTVTGTVSCGLLLLRMVDPQLKSPATMEIALMNIMVLPFVGGCTILVNGPVWWQWSVAMTVGVFLAVMGLSLVLMRIAGFSHRSCARDDA